MISHKVLAAAWAAWHVRHGGRLGPGPGFVEAITAALLQYELEQAENVTIQMHAGAKEILKNKPKKFGALS